MYKSTHIALAIAAAFALAACQQEAPAPATLAAQTSTTTPAAAPDAATGVIAPVTSPLMDITPASMTACDSATVATVHWDVRSAHPKVATVSIYAGFGADAKLFVTAGASGETQTGPWVRPGSQFQLKDAKTGTALGQITVGGPKCS